MSPDNEVLQFRELLPSTAELTLDYPNPAVRISPDGSELGPEVPSVAGGRPLEAAEQKLPGPKSIVGKLKVILRGSDR